MKRLVVFLTLLLSLMVWSPAEAASLSKLALSATTVAGGGTVSAVITLDVAAPSGGQLVTMASNSSYAVVSNITIPGGKKSASVKVVTSRTSTSRTAIISATTGGVTRAATLIVDDLSLSLVSASPSLLTSASTVTGTVKILGTADPGGYVVSLSSGSSNVIVPSSVTIPAGKSIVTFVITSRTVTSTTPVVISAAAGGITKTTQITVAPLELIRLSSSTAITGGNGATGKVTFNGKTTVGGASVSLVSSNPALAVVPATVAAPADVASVTFPITTSFTATERTVSFTATYQGVSKSFTMTLKPVLLSGLTVNPTTIVSSQVGLIKVNLTGPAPADGIVVNLSSGDSALAVPATATVLAGATSVTIPVTAGLVPSLRVISISATIGPITKVASASVSPITLSGITVDNTPTGGNRTVLAIALNAPAPAGGIVVDLLSSNPGVLSVPSSVEFAAGLRYLTIDIYPAIVTVDTMLTVTASHLVAVKTATITVQPAHFLNIGMNPPITTGGGVSQATVTLTGPAPAGGVIVNLSASVISPLPAGTVPASLQSTVLVPAGARFARVPVTTGAVSVKTVMGIRGWSYDRGPTDTDAVTTRLTANPALLEDFYPRPIAVTPGGLTPIIIRLTGTAPAGGVVVALSSSNPAIATIPSSVTIPAGARSVSVNVTGTPGGTVGTTTTIRVVALGRTIEAPATVSTLQLSDLALSVVRVVGGNTLTGTVRLNGPAPAGGASVGLYVLDGSVTLPGSVSIATGATSATFTITTDLVSTPKGIVVYSQFSSSTRTADLLIDALGPVTVTLDDNDIEGGESATGTITLNATTPATGGAEITALIFASPAKVGVPASVTFAPSSTTATFVLTGIPVAIDTPITLVVEVNGRSTSNTRLTVHPPRVESLSITTASVTGGTSNTGTVRLTSPAPSGGWQVELSSDNVSATPVNSVVVAAGALTASFTIGTQPVAVDTNPVITAARNGTSATATFLIKPPRLTTLALNDGDLEGGYASATGTVTLNGPAPTGGWTIALTSSSAASATGPASVTVAAGATTGTFTVSTSVVPSDVTVTITATKGADTFTQPVVVRQIKVIGIVLSVSSVQGGDAITATITINRSVPTLGVAVNLSSANAAASMPATFVVPVGQTTATVNVATVPVAINTTARLTASFNGGSAGADLLVLAPVVTAVSAAPSPLIGGWATATGSVTISHVAPVGGFTVDLSASNGGGGVPATVVVPAGATVGSFTITTTVVANDRTVTITAARAGISTTVAIVVRPLITSGLSILPVSVNGGDQSATATLTLNANAPAGGAVVTLGSDHESHATVAGTVTVPAGTSSTTFTVTSVKRNNPRLVTITAAYNGTSRSTTLQVNPPLLQSLSVSPGSTVGGGSVTGTVTIGAPAGVDGFPVALASDTLFALVPASVVIASGQSTATFTVSTLAIASNRTVTITATANGVAKTDTFTIGAPTLTAITLSASPVLGGTTLTATATISSAAPSGGLTITMASNRSQASVVNIAIAAGATTGSADVTTQGVTSNTSVTITGSLNGTSRNASFQITKTSLAAVDINPDVVEGGVNTTGTIYLNGVAPVGGVTVALSDGSSVVTTAASVTVPAGATQVNFLIDTDDVGSTQTKLLTAVYDGVSVSHSITLLD